jgi:hypothetical protein
MTETVKIIRLQSGEDIIAGYLEDEETALLYNPLHMIVKRTTKGSVMLMLPWLPVEMIKENVSSIYLTDILTIVDPKDSAVEYYQNALQKLQLQQDVEKEISDYENEYLAGASEDVYTDVLRNTKIGIVH